MHRIGPYEFTDEDAERTLAHAGDLFDLLAAGLGADALAALAPHRDRGEAAVVALLDEVVASGTADGTGRALGEVWDAWRAGAAAVRATGAFGGPTSATVAGLFRSDGGVPKQPVDELEITWSGVVGDRQEDRRNHGRPWQALCLWSTEVIDDFVAAGNPLAPGLAGENITLTGLPWHRVRPGVQLRIGDVLAEVWAYAVPCNKNAAWFAGGHFGAMHHRNGAVSRVYATVLEPGRVRQADAVLLEPDA